MGGESVNEETPKVEQVTSAGNSWIICRSKSHSGRIYYFNTLTGEAAWNLSDAEMEKARKTTRNMTNQEELSSCPEPKDPPSDLQNHSSQSNNNNISPIPTTSTIYNKIITNKFPKQPYPISPFFGINQLMPIAVNAAGPVFNSNVWGVPTGQQIYFTPPIPPLVNQEQIPYDQGSGVFVQNINNTIPKFNKLRRKSFDASSNKHEKRQGFVNKGDKHQGSGKKNFGDFDLRKVLSAKRMQRNYHSDVEDDDQESRKFGWSDHEESQTAFHIEDITFKQHDEQSNADSDWLEESLLAKDGKIRLNVTNLRKLAKPDMEPDCWYIVTDKDIMMKHFNFLNILCDSDEECYLMVPQQVLTELHTAKEGPPHLAERARRALSYISQQLDNGYVVIGDANYGDSDTRCDYLRNCCETLLEQKNHVVLLSNDDGFRTTKNNSKIPIFSVTELKQFLAKPTAELKLTNVKPDRLKPPPCLNKTNKSKKITLNNDLSNSTNENNVLPDENRVRMPIKITVNNELGNSTHEDIVDHQVNETSELIEMTPDNELVNSNSEDTVSSKVDKETQFHVEVSNEETQKDELSSQEGTMSQRTDTSVKKTSEIGVQTDALPMNIDLPFNSSIDSMKTSFDLSSKESLKSDDGQTKASDHTDDMMNKWTQKRPTKREIRLNRYTTLKKTETETTVTENKKFRWRRRRNASGNSSNDPSTAGCSFYNQNNNFNEKEARNENEKHQASDESLLSESSCYRNRNVTNEKIIIEETSTSGIISNTTSNVDSESESGNLSVVQFNFTQPQAQKVLFEVTDQRMENSLRIMNDEWVSRFLQIMEEVMTQILRQDQKFLNEVVYRHHGGGPWTILEATDCIRIKFKNNCDVVDAANKLTDTLSRISDSSGRINETLQPSEYMETYSYGVYLVETLKSALGNCEDLTFASQSLSTLLKDIQNPNLDSMHNETFGDQVPLETSFPNVIFEEPVTQDTSVNISHLQSPKTPQGVTPIASPKKSSPKCQIVQSPKDKAAFYNLRSKYRSTSAKTIPVKIAPDKTTLDKNIPVKITPDKTTPVKTTPVKTTPVKITPDKTTPDKTTPVKTTPVKITPDKTTAVKITPDKTTPVKTTPDKTTPVKTTPDKTTPVKETCGAKSSGTNTPTKYDKENEGKNTEQTVKFIRKINVQDSFFASLDLVKKSVTNDFHSQNTSTNQEISNFHQVTKSIFDRNATKPTKESNVSVNSGMSQIVRKFTICPEYEKKLNQIPEQREPLDMDQLDYSEYCNEDEHMDPYYSDDNLSSNGHNKHDQIEDSLIKTVCNNTEHSNYEPYTSELGVDNCGDFENNSPLNVNNNLNYIFNRIIGSIKKACLDIRNFCDETSKELVETTYSGNRKCELQEKTQRAQILIDNLCKSLNSIYGRETYEPENNIQSLLKKAGINDFDFDADQLNVYRKTIGNCLDQAKILQDSVAALGTIVKNKPTSVS